MKRHWARIAALILAYLALFFVASAFVVSQDESSKTKDGDPSKGNDKKTAGKAQSTITVHMKVSAEGLNSLPSGSSAQLKGLGSCDTLERQGTLDPEGKITFSGLPVCKVMIKILITGIDSKMLPEVNLANYKDSPIRIEIKSAGAPILK